MTEMSSDIESIAQKALQDEGVLSEVLQGVLSAKDAVRFHSFQVLLRLSEGHPGILYPQWGFFAGLIDSDNAYRKFIAVHIIANLTRADIENRFEEIFDKFYHLFNDSVIVAGHVAADSGKIARAKPNLQSQITNRLLNIDKTNQKHKDLVKAGAIEAFDEYYEEAENKEGIVEFVRQQLQCTSPKTRKKAREFLKKWGEG